MEKKDSVVPPAPKYRHDLGFERVMQNKTDGEYVIKRQADIDTPFLNPETLTGKLLWFTQESGYDYCHPESKAKERAEKICKAYNQYDELTAENEALKEANRELLHFVKMCHNMFTASNFTDRGGYGDRAQELLTKHSPKK